MEESNNSQPPSYESLQKRPSSPPATRSYPPSPSSASHTAPFCKRTWYKPQAQLPSPEYVATTRKEYHYHFGRPHSTDSPRPSSTSDFLVPAASLSPGPAVDHYVYTGFWQASQNQSVNDGGIVIEEVLEGDPSLDGDIEVLRPDRYEEADSDSENNEDDNGGSDAELVRGLRRLHCESGGVSGVDVGRSPRSRNKRWSAGLKRTHAQSVSSNADVGDAEDLDAHDAESSARRMRRRVRGPGNRSFLAFEDIPSASVAETEDSPNMSVEQTPMPSDVEHNAMDTSPSCTPEELMELD
ncbi:hypothetical protein B0A49_06765 [Cryomyces minteri]|uniref:Uncharacterized protein n=1 Tax=Cryomyces minteri TaxID=331657 RepID=A0A4U0X1B7_9PEZI|nr:hypothetical protein B0A49_06765 [Cryomyces minteri]